MADEIELAKLKIQEKTGMLQKKYLSHLLPANREALQTSYLQKSNIPLATMTDFLS